MYSTRGSPVHHHLRRSLGSIAPLALIACTQSANDAALQACDEFIKSRIDAPSTYERVSVEQFDAPATEDEYIKATQLDVTERVFRLMLDTKLERGLAFRHYLISYDAANKYGTLTRAQRSCTLEIVGGKLQSPEEIEAALGRAIMRANSQDLARRGILPDLEHIQRDRKRSVDCCLP